MSEIQQRAMNREDAERLTEKIRHTATTFMEARDKLSALIREAQEGQAHLALGYRSWTEYVAQVFSDTPLMRLTRDERRVIVADLSEQGMSTRAIAPVVGVTQQQVSRDRQVTPDVSPESPATPPEPDSHDLVMDTGNVCTTKDSQILKDRIFGIDGKQYARPAPAPTSAPVQEERPKPRRRPLPDQFFDTVYDFRKNAERLQKLVSDDRFQNNKKQVALKHKNDLLQLADVLQHVLRELD